MDAAHEAVTRLWGELSSSLQRWFASQTGDTHEADDLLQECFLRVHDRLGELQDEDRLAAWIQQIARNLVVDWRRRRRSESMGEDVAREEEVSNLDTVVAGWLTPAIEELSESDRETLRLTELLGVTQRDAAERLGISLSAVKSRVLRGRERLRERVLACCELEFDRRGGIVAYRARSSACCDS